MKIILMGLSFNEKDFQFHLNNAYDFSARDISDFNMISENKKLSNFCEMNKFEHLILKPTCFRGLLPSAIDLLLTYHKQSFMRSNVFEKGISDHHKMIVSVLRKTFAKDKPKTVIYCCYKIFDQHSFYNEILENRISLPDLSLENFFEIFQSTLDSFASL